MKCNESQPVQSVPLTFLMFGVGFGFMNLRDLKGFQRDETSSETYSLLLRASNRSTRCQILSLVLFYAAVRKLIFSTNFLEKSLEVTVITLELSCKPHFRHSNGSVNET
jgi:hypothetical protein